MFKIKLLFIICSDLFLFVALSCQILKGAFASTDCESIEDVTFHSPINFVKTCCMNSLTAIDEPSTQILTVDSSVQGLYMWNNRKIKYLPKFVDESFPNLLAYGANSLSLTSIEKANFKGLFKLKALWLSDNEIETVPSNVFEDLISLESFSLCKKNAWNWLIFYLIFWNFSWQ